MTSYPIPPLRLAYDSVNPGAIPRNAAIVMGYVPPSRFAWTDAQWTLFPNSIHVRITPSAAVFGPGVHMLDVEPGDATIAQVPEWIINSRAAGQEGSIYCSASIWEQVQAAVTTAELTHPPYVVAAYPGNGPTLPTLNGITATGHQYAGSATSGGDYDLSAIAPYWPGVDPLPAPRKDTMGIQTFSYGPTYDPATSQPVPVRHVFGTETASVSQVVNQSWIWFKCGWGTADHVRILAADDHADYLADQTWTQVAPDSERPLIQAPDGTTQYSVEIASGYSYTITIVTSPK